MPDPVADIDDLVSFFRACLDEDEAVAKAAYGDTWTLGKDRGPTYWYGSGSEPRPLPESCEYVVYGVDYLSRVGQVANLEAAHSRNEVGCHITRWDPARVLAEVASKRAVLDLHSPKPQANTASSWYPGTPALECVVCSTWRHLPWPCPTVLALVQPCADRPGFNPAWLQEVPPRG